MCGRYTLVEWEELGKLQAMLVPYPPAEMKCYDVATVVNSQRNDTAAAIEPV